MAAPDSIRKSQAVEDKLVIWLNDPTIATIIQQNTATTHVRSAVAISESVVLTPHFARIETAPANRAEANAAVTHENKLTPLRSGIFLSG